MILEEVSELLVGRLGKSRVLLPEVGSEVLVGVGHSVEGGKHEVTLCSSLSSGGCVGISHTSEAEDLLGDSTSDETSTTRGWDNAEAHGTTLTGHLARHGVRLAEDGTPVSETDRDQREFGDSDGTTDGGGNLTRAFHTKTDMSGLITNNHERLEARALTGRGHLLDGADFDNLILEIRAEVINDGGLLDGKGEDIDVLKLADVSGLNETAELGHRDPLALLITASTTATTTTSTASSTASTATK